MRRLLAPLLVLLAACAPAVSNRPADVTVLSVSREPFIELGETGVNATAHLRNAGGPGTVRLLLRLEAAGDAWTHARDLTLAAGETRAVPVRFEEPAFANRLASLGVRALGTTALATLSGPTAAYFGNVLAEKLGLSGVEALSDLLEIKASATVQPLGALGSPDPAFTGLTVEAAPGGLRVTGVRGGSPAATAGIVPRARNLFGTVTREGDLLTTVGNSPVASLAEYERAISLRRAGERVELRLQRDGKPLTVSLVLGAAREYTRGR
jgi:S1-C subfamily serine protease